MSTGGFLNGLFKLAIVAAVVGAALAVNAVLDHMTRDQRLAERRALLQRNADLGVSTLAPGSVLSCLDGNAGEAVETACERSVFANPENAAAAVAYVGARLTLLADAADFAKREPRLAETFAPARRALELDRYGLVAHVLATRDGCTAESCGAFGYLRDTAALKANLKAQVFDQYVSRYADSWTKTQAAVPQAPAPAQVPVASAQESAPVPAPQAAAGQPVSSKYDFPSAASIPPVSIMNAEPALPKGAADALAAQPKGATKPEAKPEAEPTVPAPPKRPQAQAATPQPPAR